jgi:DNA sulfur modification protein DndC
MEALVDKGEEWLEPLLEVRDELARTQDPKVKVTVRQHIRKNGTVSKKTKGDTETDKIVRGPYTLDYCREVLRRVLEAEVKAKALAPDGQHVELISDEELVAIRRVWRFERDDWEDSVARIVAEVGSRQVMWGLEDTAVFAEEDEQLLAELCEDRGVPVAMVKRLIDCERELAGLRRRAEIRDRLHDILGKEWRDEAEVVSELTEMEFEGVET